MKAPRPIAKWRLYPDADVPSRYVVVQIFRTLGEMRAWCQRHLPRTISGSGRCCTGKHRYRRALGVCAVAPSLRAIAVVTLAKDHCYPKVASHEFQHATMAYLNRCILGSQRRGTRDLMAPDLIFGPIGEQLAHFNGNLNREFYNRLHEAGMA